MPLLPELTQRLFSTLCKYLQLVPDAPRPIATAERISLGKHLIEISGSENMYMITVNGSPALQYRVGEDELTQGILAELVVRQLRKMFGIPFYHGWMANFYLRLSRFASRNDLQCTRTRDLKREISLVVGDQQFTASDPEQTAEIFIYLNGHLVENSRADYLTNEKIDQVIEQAFPQ